VPPDAQLRAAVRRLTKAANLDAVEVTVQRRDIELLLMVVIAAETLRRLKATPPTTPLLHPAQR
jgi:hypothetical protein